MQTNGNINCGKYRININDYGVSVWDVEKCQWIIDASTIAKDHSFQLGTFPGNAVKEIDRCAGINLTFVTRHYKGKAKSRRTTTAKNSSQAPQPKGK